MTAFDIKKNELNASTATLKEENPVIFRKPIKIGISEGIKGELRGLTTRSAL